MNYFIMNKKKKLFYFCYPITVSVSSHRRRGTDTQRADFPFLLSQSPELSPPVLCQRLFLQWFYIPLEYFNGIKLTPYSLKDYRILKIIFLGVNFSVKPLLRSLRHKCCWDKILKLGYYPKKHFFFSCSIPLRVNLSLLSKGCWLSKLCRCLITYN